MAETTTMTQSYHTIIIGAGIAGMSAARALTDANLPVLVIDKGRGLSGRMATRRWGDASFDHGAQYFSARTPAFQSFIEKANAGEVVKSWQPGISRDGHPRWIGLPGMNAVPKALAEGIEILTSKKVVQIKEADENWEVHTEDGDTFRAQALLITIPAPQAMQLLENSGIALPGNPLADIAYHPCLVVMAKLDQPSGLPAPGGLLTGGKVVSWLADNYRKGISKTPSVTIHASPEFSQRHLDGDLQAAAKTLLSEAKKYIAPAQVLEWQVHRWRYSLCYQRHPAAFWAARTAAPLLFGGDGFGMGNVEGAFISGKEMAGHILQKKN